MVSWFHYYIYYIYNTSSGVYFKLQSKQKIQPDSDIRLDENAPAIKLEKMTSEDTAPL